MTSQAMLSAPTASTPFAASHSEALLSMPGPARKRSGSSQKSALPVRINTTSPALTLDTLPAAARFEIGGGDQVTGIERAHTALGGGIEQHAGRHDGRHLFDGVDRESFRGGNLRRGDPAVEHLSVGLMADGVDVGAAMLHADDDPGGAATHAELGGPVVVTVPAMEEIRVPGLVDRDDRHTLIARLLQIEHADRLIDQRQRSGCLVQGRADRIRSRRAQAGQAERTEGR